MLTFRKSIQPCPLLVLRWVYRCNKTIFTQSGTGTHALICFRTSPLAQQMSARATMIKWKRSRGKPWWGRRQKETSKRRSIWAERCHTETKLTQPLLDLVSTIFSFQVHLEMIPLPEVHLNEAYEGKVFMKKALIFHIFSDSFIVIHTYSYLFMFIHTYSG